MAMIGVDPSTWKDPINSSCSAIGIPMYDCEQTRDQRFPTGPTWTRIADNELDRAHKSDDQVKPNPMIIQTIPTNQGEIKIKLDPQSLGLAPFFSDQYEAFIKGPPKSIFLSSYVHARRTAT
jgi:hypothetical protein